MMQGSWRAQGLWRGCPKFAAEDAQTADPFQLPDFAGQTLFPAVNGLCFVAPKS